MNAFNFDGAGNAATSSTVATTWSDLVSPFQNGALSNFTLPTNGISGWDNPNSVSLLRFDGSNDFVDVSNEAAFDFSNGDPITLEAWVRPTNIQINDKEFILSKGLSGSGENYGLDVVGTLMGVGALEFLYTDVGSNSHIFRTTTSPIVNNNFYHVAVTYSFGTGSTAMLYLNGCPVAGSYVTGNGNSIPLVNDFTVRLGAKIASGSNEFFDGDVSKVRVYGSALTSNQINQNYLAEFSSYQMTANVCTSSSGGFRIDKSDKFEKLLVNVLSSPQLAMVYNLPSQRIDSDVNAGFTLTNSLPSFEVELPENISVNPSDVQSVELKDSDTGTVYKNLKFAVSGVSGTTNKLVVSIEIPSQVNGSELRFLLNLKNNDSLAGSLYALKPLNIEILSERKTRKVGNPQITRITALEQGQYTSLVVRGANFIGKTYFFKDGKSTKFVVNENGTPNTLVSVLPSQLGVTVKDVKVSQSGNSLKILLDVPAEVTNTKGVLVISTPAGIISKEIILP